MSNIRIDDLSKYLKEVMDEYETEVKEAVDKSLVDVGKETVKELKKTSPKDRGRYAKSWKYRIDVDRLGKKMTVYNSKYYMLTHLLEKGHARVGGGRTTDAVPHIKPAQDKAIKKVVQEIKRRIDNDII